MATGAIVNISDGTDTIPLRELKAGVYATEGNVAGKVGKKYTLHVKLPDGREFTASDSLEACAEYRFDPPIGKLQFLYGMGTDTMFCSTATNLNRPEIITCIICKSITSFIRIPSQK